MPIRINLLAEEQKQKLARQRDPMKLALRLAILWVLLLGVASLMLYARQQSMKAQLAALTQEWEQRDKSFIKITREIEEFKAISDRADLIRLKIKSRFLWAPQLDLYKEIVPGNIQLTRMVCKRDVATPAPSVGGTKAPPPQPTEMVKVVLEGTAEGERPELVVHEFLTTLKHNEQLVSWIEEIKLASLTRDTLPIAAEQEGVNPNENALKARFVIEVHYKQNPVKQRI